MYSAASASGPWTGPVLVSITGHGVKGVVDPSPILSSAGDILLYYAMANDDHLTSVPSIGVAQSSDGMTFTHRAVAHAPGNVSDPFPLRIDDAGTIRLFFSQKSPTVLSATSPDGFSFRAEEGVRSTIGGVPGALRIGSTYYLYVNGSGGTITYLTSQDGLNFVEGGTTGLAGQSPSPIDTGGVYVMSYTCVGGANAATHESCVASSTDGVTWTQTSRIGRGSVPGLVRDRNGLLRAYVVSFP